MNNLRETIKETYNHNVVMDLVKNGYSSRVLADYFTVDYVTAKGNYHIRFCNDFGKWNFRICESNYPYADGDYIYVSEMLSKGNTLTDRDIEGAVAIIESLNL